VRLLKPFVVNNGLRDIPVIECGTVTDESGRILCLRINKGFSQFIAKENWFAGRGFAYPPYAVKIFDKSE
jgi:hypothetical protein